MDKICCLLGMVVCFVGMVTCVVGMVISIKGHNKSADFPIARM